MINYKFETLCKEYKIEYGNHDAEYDAVSCGRLFAAILMDYNYPKELFTGTQLGNRSYLSKPASLQYKPANLEGIVSDVVDVTATLDFFKEKCCVIT